MTVESGDAICVPIAGAKNLVLPMTYMENSRSVDVAVRAHGIQVSASGHTSEIRSVGEVTV